MMMDPSSSSSSPRLLFDKLLPIRTTLFSKDPIHSRQESVQVKDQLCDLLTILENPTDMEACSVELFRFMTDMLVSALLRIKKSSDPYENVVETWLKCMRVLVAYPQWQLGAASGPLFQQLMIVFSNMIAPPATAAKDTPNRPVPEEIQHLAVECIAAMLPAKGPKADHDLLRNVNLVVALRDLRFRPQVSYCLAALLDVALKADLLQLRIDAIHTLSRLLLDNLEERDIIATVLPRIVSTLCRIVYQKKEKENHRIIVAALDLLGDVIVTVLQDNQTPDYMIPTVTSFKDLANVGIAKRQEGDVDDKDEHDRTREWYASTKERIKENLDRILTAQSHREWRARLAFVRFASKLLNRCVRTLDNCVPDLLKTMILHIDDEYRQVANECKLELQIIMKSQSLDQVIMPTLKTSLYAAVAALPGCLVSSDEGDKVNALALVTGYVLVLGRQAENLLNTSISRHLDAWLAALAIDENGMNALDEAQQSSNKYAADLNDDETGPVLVYPKIRFKHLVSDRTAGQATRMLNVIGRNCNLRYWINRFKGCLQQDDWQPQAAYVIHALLSGASNAEAENDHWWMAEEEVDDEVAKAQLKATALQTLRDIVDLVIDPVSEPGMTSRALVPGGRHPESGSLDMDTAHVLSICFSLQIIGLLAVILERKYMQDELITLLYPILAHLGSPNIYIHSYALITLDVIALICGLRSAKELALDNTDYVINMVTQRMTSLADNLQAPLVLKALVRIGGQRMVDYLGDTVEEIFDALDRFHMNDWMCAQLCSVLTEIVLVHHQTCALLDDQAFVDPTGDERDSSSSSSDSANNVSKEIQEFIAARRQKQEEPKETATMDEIERYFLERQQQKETQDETDETQGPTSAQPPEEAPIPLTSAQQMTMDIMQKAYHFLTAPSPYLRTEILGLFGTGATVLKDRPEKLAPLIATAWPSIVSRLSGNDVNHTVIQAVVCVGKLSECLNDYMSRKFVDDVWPKLKVHLRRHSDSISTSSSAQYYSPFSYISKLHRSILQTIRAFLDHVYLPAAKVPEIAEETKRFLDERFHPDLQEDAIEVFLALGRRQADTVWLCLLSLLGDRAIVKEDERVFVVPEWMRVKDKYLVRNAQRLLDQLGS